MIYFIHYPDLNAIKIGYSVDPEQRLRSLRTANPGPLKLLGVIEGERDREAKLHRKFAHLRLNGEWFRCDPELFHAIDQLTDAPMKLFGREIRSVYLAGKITGDDWRTDIIQGKGYYDSVSDIYDEWIPIDGYCQTNISIPGDVRVIGYTGPFWFNLYGGHGRNDGVHAYGEQAEHGGYCETDVNIVRNKCLESISKSDLLFAWIDRKDCYGTIAEIAFAYARQQNRSSRVPVIVVATPAQGMFDDLWFPISMADHFIAANSPLVAWRYLWASTSATPCYPGGSTITNVDYTYYNIIDDDEIGNGCLLGD